MRTKGVIGRQRALIAGRQAIRRLPVVHTSSSALRSRRGNQEQVISAYVHI